MTHEFGHILGIHHHLPNGAPLPPYTSDWKLTDNGGKVKWPEDDFRTSRGVRYCTMRYQEANADVDDFKLKHLWYNALHYCRAGDPAMKQGDPSDNCFGQIDVKMDP